LNNFPFSMNLIATKQSPSYGVASSHEIASAHNHSPHLKFFHVPRNDAAVVSYAETRIVIWDGGLKSFL
jgi:hypothetical protein